MKEQIEKMAEAYAQKNGGFINKPFTWGYESYKQGIIDTLGRLDIDEDQLLSILIPYELGTINPMQLKQQILNSIKLKV